MNRYWLSSYREGVPADIQLPDDLSLKTLVEDRLRRYKNLPAFSNMGSTLSYGEVDQLSRYLAAFLQSSAGLSPGDRVAVMMPNLLQYPVTIFGIHRAGMAVVNVNPMYTARELKHQLNDSGARAIVILDMFAETLQKVISETDVATVIVTSIGDLFAPLKRFTTNFTVKRIKRLVPAWDIADAIAFRRALADGRWQPLEEVSVRPEDVAFLQYTGGTTGVSKGAVLTHRNILANVLQGDAWFTGYVTPGADIPITALPLYHIYSLTCNLLTFVNLGGHNILITNPRDTGKFLKELKRYPFTYISGVNTLFNTLLSEPDFADIDFRHLRIASAGGMAVQRAVADQWQRVTGRSLVQGYGLTETSPVVTSNPPDVTAFSGSVGLPLPSTDVCILNEQDQPVGVGEVGEICVRGPQVMAGYWNRPKETSEVMFDGEWLRTGDMGRMDEQGYLFIEDRKKDMIIVSGFNVYPNEIEDVVMEHPGVVEVAAVGVPDEHSGEAVKLFVVRKDATLTAEAIRDYCRNQLTAYKVPRSVEFRDELPKTNVGKILRRALRDERSGPSEGSSSG
jgi:long-chain acyl-CoA synthetase